ncbi:MAG: exodeoxyribonuclease VII large subunit [Rikenellaceae bacterium]
MNNTAQNSISLSELTTAIGSVLHSRFNQGVWVVAEVSECKVNSSGHCYLSLVERKEGAASPVAEIRAAIWARQYIGIAARFRAAAGEDITPGMKLLMHCAVSFHSNYGLSLVVDDIDATYTIGESEMLKRQTLSRLESEGVLGLQREQNQLPYVVQRLAVISSATAAGYEDFCKQIEDSPYRFEITLFEAMMQGERTTTTVMAAMNSVLSSTERFDAVVIIRGGGSASDLRWFDSYDLCYYISQFPIAVLTGIGHEKDVSVADMVAYHSFKTPTAVAAGLIERIGVVDNKLIDYRQAIENTTSQIFAEEWRRIDLATNALKSTTQNILAQNTLKLERLRMEIPRLFSSIIAVEDKRLMTYKNRVVQESGFTLQSSQNKLKNLAQGLRVGTQQITQRENNRLQRLEATLLPSSLNIINRAHTYNASLMTTTLAWAQRAIEQTSAKKEYLQLTFIRVASTLLQREGERLNILSERVKAHNPRRILSLGYSITFDENGRAVKSLNQLTKNSTLNIEFADGTAQTIVKNINKK